MWSWTALYDLVGCGFHTITLRFLNSRIHMNTVNSKSNTKDNTATIRH